MNYFIENGWIVGGNVDVVVKVGNKGVFVEGEGYLGNVIVYIMIESGFIL